METERIPWLFAVATAAWFGWMAQRSGRTRALWAVGGGAFGLVVSTLVLGFGNASSIPFSEHERTVGEMEWIAVAFLLILVFGWSLTSGLHRRETVIRGSFSPGLASPEPIPSQSKSVPPPKPPPAKPN